MPLFDTHCHLTDPRFQEDLPQVIERMRQAGVELAVVVGDAAQDPASAFDLCQEHPFLYAAAGVHPHDASCWDEGRAQMLEAWMGREKAVALGEIGLDYHYDLSPRLQQRLAFDDQLDMAYRLNKPAILHIREAHGEATAILSARWRAGRLPLCVMHCYSGSWESARTYLDMGMYLSFTGSVTFKNAAKLPEVAQKMPLDRLMVETLYGAGAHAGAAQRAGLCGLYRRLHRPAAGHGPPGPGPGGLRQRPALFPHRPAFITPC